MKRLLLTACMSLCAGFAQAASYYSEITQPNEVVWFDFNVASNSTVNAWTESSQNQLGSADTDPLLSLWRWRSDFSEWLLLDTNDDAYGAFGSANQWDSGLALTLIAGDYRATVTNSMNMPFGPFLSDGFNGNGANTPDNIGVFSLNVNISPTTGSIPTPTTIWLVISGLLAWTGSTRRKKTA